MIVRSTLRLSKKTPCRLRVLIALSSRSTTTDIILKQYQTRISLIHSLSPPSNPSFLCSYSLSLSLSARTLSLSLFSLSLSLFALSHSLCVLVCKKLLFLILACHCVELSGGMIEDINNKVIQMQMSCGNIQHSPHSIRIKYN